MPGRFDHLFSFLEELPDLTIYKLESQGSPDPKLLNGLIIICLVNIPQHIHNFTQVYMLQLHLHEAASEIRQAQIEFNFKTKYFAFVTSAIDLISFLIEAPIDRDVITQLVEIQNSLLSIQASLI